MKILVNVVHPDEPCYGLFEGPDRGRWVQKVWVVRGDALARLQTDYGAAENFSRIQPLIMPSDGENSVAELQYHAEKNRQDDYWARRRDEMLASSTLIPDVINQIERQARPSVFGPAVSVERN